MKYFLPNWEIMQRVWKKLRSNRNISGPDKAMQRAQQETDEDEQHRNFMKHLKRHVRKGALHAELWHALTPEQFERMPGEEEPKPILKRTSKRKLSIKDKLHRALERIAHLEAENVRLRSAMAITDSDLGCASDSA